MKRIAALIVGMMLVLGAAPAQAFEFDFDGGGSFDSESDELDLDDGSWEQFFGTMTIDNFDFDSGFADLNFSTIIGEVVDGVFIFEDFLEGDSFGFDMDVTVDSESSTMSFNSSFGGRFDPLPDESGNFFLNEFAFDEISLFMEFSFEEGTFSEENEVPEVFPIDALIPFSGFMDITFVQFDEEEDLESYYSGFVDVVPATQPIPLPGAVWLLAAGVGAVALRKRA